MSCFWNGLRNKIPELHNKTPKQIVEYFQQHNRMTLNVRQQNTTLKCQEMKENIEAINTYKIQDGHLTSSSDPFLLLSCELFFLDIQFMFDSHMICIKNTKKVNHTVRFDASKNHFT